MCVEQRAVGFSDPEYQYRPNMWLLLPINTHTLSSSFLFFFTSVLSVDRVYRVQYLFLFTLFFINPFLLSLHHSFPTFISMFLLICHSFPAPFPRSSFFLYFLCPSRLLTFIYERIVGLLSCCLCIFMMQKSARHDCCMYYVF